MQAILATVKDPADLAKVSASGLPYRFDQIFTAQGFGAKRLEKKRLKLMKAIDAEIQGMLGEGERVEFVSWGNDYSFVEAYFMGIWAQLLNRRAVVLTDRRILLLQIGMSNKMLDLRYQLRYHAIQKITSSRLGHMKITLRDRKTITLTGVPRKDRNNLRQRMDAHVAAVRSEPPGTGRDNLCPHCGAKVRDFPERCKNCAGAFKSGAKAGWLSLLWPGLGDFYLGHRLLGTMEVLGGIVAWSVMLVVLIAPDEKGGEIVAPDLTVLALAAVVVFAAVHGMDSWITRRVGLKGIYPDHS